ncbi:IMP dehydrogenase [Candidatus Woesebacteria bacterium]|nr:IMP dehydrogenase [Candidatus Woesebacteria bacterium]
MNISKLPFSSFRDNKLWETYIGKKLSPLEKDITTYLKYWYIESQENSRAYPSQGLLKTPYDFLDINQSAMLPLKQMTKILRIRLYFLEIFNHPERIAKLDELQKQKFVAPPKVESHIMERNIKNGLAVSIADLGIRVEGSQRARVSRKVRLNYGPFVKLGKYARSILVGSAMPDIWGSVYAISTMAQCLSLVGVPRNGPFNEIKRQADLAKQVFEALEQSDVLIGRTKSDQKHLLEIWKRNVMGVVDAVPEKALKRAKALYKVGVRCFRIYSPEPGKGAVDTVVAMRKEFGKGVELFVGQVVDVLQAKQLEEAGADGLYVGIGGGGRCITGVRSGSVIDWPILLWEMRGEINIPVVVEGGASDHIATTLALGASGIGVSRIAAGGTIESPGGMLYYIGKNGEYFKPYGGEASARTKFLDNKMLPFDMPSFVEGETRRAYMNHLPYGVPTIPFHIHNLTEDIILSFVFRSVKNIHQLQALDPSPIRLNTPQGANSQKTH